MKLILMALGLVAAIATAVQAAPQSGADTGVFSTPQEALKHEPSEISDDCQTPTDPNACVVALVALDGPGHLLWSVALVPRERTMCVDEATADDELDCAAPGAVLIVRPEPPMMVIREFAPGPQR